MESWEQRVLKTGLQVQTCDSTVVKKYIIVKETLLSHYILNNNNNSNKYTDYMKPYWNEQRLEQIQHDRVCHPTTPKSLKTLQ